MTNKTNMTDEQLAQELRKRKGGKLGGKLLSLLGVVVAIVGIVLGGSIVLIVIGGVLLALGQMVQGKRKEAADRQVFDTLAPEVVNSVFENADLSLPSIPCMLRIPTFLCRPTPATRAADISAGFMRVCPRKCVPSS